MSRTPVRTRHSPQPRTRQRRKRATEMELADTSIPIGSGKVCCTGCGSKNPRGGPGRGWGWQGMVSRPAPGKPGWIQSYLIMFCVKCSPNAMEIIRRQGWKLYGT